MNWLEFLGVVFIISTIAEAYLIYKYRFTIRQLFVIVSQSSVEPNYDNYKPDPDFDLPTPIVKTEAFKRFYDEQFHKYNRDSRGRFTKRPA